MSRHRPRLIVLATTLTAAMLLAAPGAAQAFQTVTIEGDTLHIVGDNGKKTDEVTITIDQFAGDYVIGHDINMTTPPAGCHFEGSGPPYKVLRCPIKGIKRIKIETGGDKDKVDLDDLVVPNPNPLVGGDVYLAPELEKVEVSAGPGNDRVTLNAWETFPAGYAPRLRGHPSAQASATGSNPAIAAVDTGSDVDTVTTNGGTNTIVFGGSGKFTAVGGVNAVSFGPGNSTVTLSGGTNTVEVGAGNSKASVSGGVNTVKFGAGNSTLTATGGSNSAVFGAGKGVYVGGPGTDSAVFGAGNNMFTGGAGDDAAALGAGNDSGTGGAGNDVMRGGAGKDRLLGGAGRDLLFGGSANDRLSGGPEFDALRGGAGHRDECFGGGPGIVLGCEIP